MEDTGDSSGCGVGGLISPNFQACGLRTNSKALIFVLLWKSQQTLSHLIDLFKSEETGCFVCLVGSSENFQSKETFLNAWVNPCVTARQWDFHGASTLHMGRDFLFVCSLLHHQYLHNALHIVGTQHILVN